MDLQRVRQKEKRQRIMGEEYYNNYSNNDIEGQPVP